MKQQDNELFEAVKNDDLQRASAAIDAGADINARDQWQNTSLHWAAHSGHTDIARLLMEKGADLNARNDKQKTPLDYVFAAKAAEVFALLNDAAKKLPTHTGRVRQGNDDQERSR